MSTLETANHDALLEAVRTSLEAALPARRVQRGLLDPVNAKRAELEEGFVCLVAESGGEFANRLGRAAQLGRMQAALVGFVAVPDKGTTPLDVERAELALLGEVLTWASGSAVPGLDTLEVVDWRGSKQLEHPYGWLVVGLSIKT